MLLLGIETAGDVCGVALMDGDRLVAEAALHVPRAHASHLVPQIQSVLQHAGVAAADLAAVAVSAGPGSFTGLRIGVSTAKGLCVATGAALVGVPTLTALALEATTWVDDPTRVIAALPSRRGQAFCALATGGPVHTLELSALAADARALVDDRGPVWIVGPAAEDVAAALRQGGAADVRAHPTLPSAVSVARLGAARLAAGQTENLAAFEPDYVAPAYVGAVPFIPDAAAGTGAGARLS
ncbi:MAG TPA: tRNA (adenosine(37)-N6)-threonylcarbamoyltransferase complex dimerization subunit type 1 TsaB [Rhodothermales bacterium]|nr:tRNA (adenosine(37)-N6)-threonylcarbamoyltransferase complex dimerization subunit type 1 TsaB [Rhodothermales bacterium]